MSNPRNIFAKISVVVALVLTIGTAAVAKRHSAAVFKEPARGEAARDVDFDGSDRGGRGNRYHGFLWPGPAAQSFVALQGA